jgi:hypothetical protein
MRLYSIALSLALATVIVVGFPSLVTADAPDHIGPIHDEGTATITSCGTFDVIDQYQLNFTQTRLFDKSGNLVKIVEQVYGTDTFTNSVTGKAYTGRYHNTVLIDPQTGLGANSGIIFRLNVPGAGVVFHDVGRLVANRDGSVITFQKGPHQAFDGDFAGLCAALA